MMNLMDLAVLTNSAGVNNSGSGESSNSSNKYGNFVEIWSVYDLEDELDSSWEYDGEEDIEILGNLQSNFGYYVDYYSTIVDINNNKPLDELTLEDVVAMLGCGKGAIFPEGVKIYTDPYFSPNWDHHEYSHDYEMEVPVVHNIDALLVIPKVIEHDEYGQYYITEYETRSYTGITYTQYFNETENIYQTYWTVPIHDIPNPLEDAIEKSVYMGYRSGNAKDFLLPKIVIEGGLND